MNITITQWALIALLILAVAWIITRATRQIRAARLASTPQAPVARGTVTTIWMAAVGLLGIIVAVWFFLWILASAEGTLWNSVQSAGSRLRGKMGLNSRSSIRTLSPEEAREYRRTNAEKLSIASKGNARVTFNGKTIDVPSMGTPIVFQINDSFNGVSQTGSSNVVTGCCGGMTNTPVPAKLDVNITVTNVTTAAPAKTASKPKPAPEKKAAATAPVPATPAVPPPAEPSPTTPAASASVTGTECSTFSKTAEVGMNYDLCPLKRLKRDKPTRKKITTDVVVTFASGAHARQGQAHDYVKARLDEFYKWEGELGQCTIYFPANHPDYKPEHQEDFNNKFQERLKRKVQGLPDYRTAFKQYGIVSMKASFRDVELL
jgi:hypothetical protein